ncbi:hypothetical protein L3X38_010312 [Prunus dulcis]|uniref:Uncharacterized protein n=1 Tax=Prunus dulcis TaxID=3755 RepID=A0AAD4WI11_PRUDU|nr:hypothetical protein L3X38_010312 [Prunus dulcis]
MQKKTVDVLGSSRFGKGWAVLLIRKEPRRLQQGRLEGISFSLHCVPSFGHHLPIDKGRLKEFEEMNVVADCMANWCFNLDLGVSYLEDAPAWVSSFLEDDFLGVVRPRLICTS